MAYLTVQELLIRFPAEDIFNLINDDHNIVFADVSWAEEDDPIVSKLKSILSTSSNFMDGFFTSYTLPFSVLPPILKQICFFVVVYNLFSRKILTDIPKSVSDNYNIALELLNNISNGSLSLLTNSPGSLISSYTDINLMDIVL